MGHFPSNPWGKWKQVKLGNIFNWVKVKIKHQNVRGMTKSVCRKIFVIAMDCMSLFPLNFSSSFFWLLFCFLFSFNQQHWLNKLNIAGLTNPLTQYKQEKKSNENRMNNKRRQSPLERKSQIKIKGGSGLVDKSCLTLWGLHGL